jgi:hypothetical protein
MRSAPLWGAKAGRKMLNAWKRWKHSGGLDRVQIGPQLVAGDATASSGLDTQYANCRNLALFPSRDRLRSNLEEFGKLSLADNFKDRPEGNVVHIGNYIHRRLSDVNSVLIAGPRLVGDHKPMVEIPKPELYGAFKDWLTAVLTARSLTKADIATIAQASPQAVTRWFKGGGVAEEQLERLATWAGADYGILRLLVEGRPVSRKKRPGQEPMVKSPDAHRISRKLDMLPSDILLDIEALVDHQLQKQAKLRKHG